jgi:predicted enzyme related to lactoylglutathione lyase
MNESPFLGLRTVVYRVEHMAQAKTWYAKLFGREPYFDEPFYIGFNIGGFELGLQPVEDGSSGRGGVEVYWGVKDIRAEWDRALKLGAKALEEPHNVGGPIEVATIQDPWGNVIGLIFNPEFSSGTHESPH